VVAFVEAGQASSRGPKQSPASVVASYPEASYSVLADSSVEAERRVPAAFAASPAVASLVVVEPGAALSSAAYEPAESASVEAAFVVASFAVAVEAGTGAVEVETAAGPSAASY
jgi:hypothetical protein